MLGIEEGNFSMQNRWWTIELLGLYNHTGPIPIPGTYGTLLFFSLSRARWNTSTTLPNEDLPPQVLFQQYFSSQVRCPSPPCMLTQSNKVLICVALTILSKMVCLSPTPHLWQSATTHYSTSFLLGKRAEHLDCILARPSGITWAGCLCHML